MQQAEHPIRDWLKSSCLLLQHPAAIPVVEAYVATASVAPELTSGRIMHGAEMSLINLRVSKASKPAGVSITLCGWDFRNKPVNEAVRSLK
jgi:hypothetical protein